MSKTDWEKIVALAEAMREEAFKIVSQVPKRDRIWGASDYIAFDALAEKNGLEGHADPSIMLGVVMYSRRDIPKDAIVATINTLAEWGAVAYDTATIRKAMNKAKVYHDAGTWTGHVQALTADTMKDWVMAIRPSPEAAKFRKIEG